MSATRGLPVGPIAVAAATALVFGVASRNFGYFFDEAYFVVAGRDHLAAGYFDQPWLIPALAGLADRIAPGSLVVLRLLSSLAAGLGALFAGLIARELGAGARAQTAAATLYATGALAVLHHWLATYSVDPVLWSLVLWLLTRWTRLSVSDVSEKKNDNLLLWSGVATAVSLQVKFLIPGLWAAVLLAALWVGPRSLLARPKLWLGAAVAALSAVPTLIWQAANGWPYALMADVVAKESGGLPGFVIGAVAAIGPGLGDAVAVLGLFMGLVLFGSGLWALACSARLRPYRYLGLAAILVLVAFAASGGRVNYALSLYPPILGAACAQRGWWLERWRAAGRTVAAMAAVVLAMASASLLLRLPVLSEHAAQGLPRALVSVLGDPLTMREGDRLTDRFGPDVAAAYEKVPAEERAVAAIVTDMYPSAAAFDLRLGKALGARAYSYHRGYWFFGSPPQTATDMLYIGERNERLRSGFRSMAVAEERDEDGKKSGVYRYRGRLAPWPQLWRQWRTW